MKVWASSEMSDIDFVFFQLFGILLLLVVIGITKHSEGAPLKEVLSQSVYDLNIFNSHIFSGNIFHGGKELRHQIKKWS